MHRIKNERIINLTLYIFIRISCIDSYQYSIVKIKTFPLKENWIVFYIVKKK